MKWLNIFRMRFVLIGVVIAIIFGSGSANADFTFGEAINLGPMINTEVDEGGPNISADGLSLYLYSFLGGFGRGTLRIATRETTEDPWGEAVSLPAPLNVGITDSCISTDGLSLYFETNNGDLYVSEWSTALDSWRSPVHLSTVLSVSWVFAFQPMAWNCTSAPTEVADLGIGTCT